MLRTTKLPSALSSRSKGFEALPDELVLQITSHLTYFDLVRLSRVSSRFLVLVYDASNASLLFRDQLDPSLSFTRLTKFTTHPVLNILSWEFTHSPNDGNPCYIGKHEIGSTPAFHMNATSPLVTDLRLIISVISDRGRGISLEVPRVRSNEGIKVHHVLRAASDEYVWNGKYWPATLKQWKGVEKIEYKNGKVNLEVLVRLIIGGRKASEQEGNHLDSAGWDCVII